MMQPSPHIASLLPYEPGMPIEEVKRMYGLQKVIKLASNESPYGASPLVQEALRNYAAGLHRYPDPRAHDARHAIAAHHHVAPDNIILGNGSNELIDLICRVFCSPGDHVVFGRPSFPSYRIAAVAASLQFTEVELRDRIHWDSDALLNAITAKTRVVFVDSPNNPTGSYLPAQELRKLAQRVGPDTLLAIDEAYVEYADAIDYQSALELQSEYKNIVTLRTFSKAFGLAALRIGYGIADASLISHLQKLRAPFNVNALAQLAACRALDDLPFVSDNAAKVRQERVRVAQALSAMRLQVAPSQANFLLVQVGGQGRALCDQLLKRGIIVRPMSPPIGDFIRVSIGTPSENDAFVSTLQALL